MTLTAGAGVGGVAEAEAEAEAVSELEDPTQVESPHLAVQTQAISSWTEMMSEREELAVVEATGSTDRLRVVSKRNGQAQTWVRYHRRTAVLDGVCSSELFELAMPDWWALAALTVLASPNRDEGCRFWYAIRLAHRYLHMVVSPNKHFTIGHEIVAGEPTLLEQYPFQ